jgi:hypothetical protein
MREKQFDENKTWDRWVEFTKRNPMTMRILAMVTLFFVMWGLFMMAFPPAPIPPAPSYTLGQAVDYGLNEFRIPFEFWLLAFVFLWMTKW